MPAVGLQNSYFDSSAKEMFQSTSYWFSPVLVWGETPSEQSGELSALSKAWSSNPLHCFSTLEPVQSNNGEPNWGPNHATERTQSGHWLKLARLPLTSRPRRRGFQDPEGSYHLISAFQVGPDVQNLLLFLAPDRFPPPPALELRWVFCVGGENEAWKFSCRCFLLKLVCKPGWRKVRVQIQDICCGFVLLPGT